MKISHIARDSRELIIPVGDEEVHISFRPGGLSPATEERLLQFAADQRGGAALVAFLADCLCDWDITDDAGKKLPVNEHTLKSLPIVFLGQIVNAISEDMHPNLTSAEPSGAGLQPKED